MFRLISLFVLVGLACAGEFSDGGVEVFDQGADDGVDDSDVDSGAEDGPHCEGDSCGLEAVVAGVYGFGEALGGDDEGVEE